jgi:hypothetical protein
VFFVVVSVADSERPGLEAERSEAQSVINLSGRFVGGVVVDDQVQVEVLVRGAVNLAQEAQELLMPVAPRASSSWRIQSLSKPLSAMRTSIAILSRNGAAARLS